MHARHRPDLYYSRPQRRHRLSSALAAALACATALPAAAQSVWVGTDSESWVNGLNWNPVGPPGPNDDVEIDTLDPNPTVLDGAAVAVEDLTIGRLAEGRLTIQGGGALASQVGVIAFHRGSFGRVDVIGPGSAWNNAQALHVGHGGHGALRIENGGSVTSATGSVGTGVVSGGDWSVSGHGEVDILGPGSAWTVAGNLFIGSVGSGSVAIGSGGTLNSQAATIGLHASSSGSVLVTGAGSSWNYAGTLRIGDSGEGSLTIADGSQAINGGAGNGLIAAEAGSTGAVAVTGAGSLWEVGGALYTGLAGSGALRIEDGATVNSGFAGIGDAQGSEGSVTVTGGSVWAGSANFVVGGGGSGTLDIADGSMVTGASFGFIGGAGGGTGTVSVSGGSGLAFTGELRVGHVGTGALHVNGGSVVNNTNAWIGNLEGSEGSATVSGLFSLWNNAGNLVVGNEGAGTLDITHRGTVINSLAMIGASVTGAGAVVVDGAGSSWNIGSNLFVGDAGSGSLVVSDGGHVDNAQGHVGLFAGSEGSVLVTGAGSTWNNASSIRVAQTGTGTVRVEDGGSLTSTGGELAIQAGALGGVTVHGTGSTWLNSADLFVGWNGTSTLAIEAGGAVANSSAQVGAQAGSQGAVTVDGAGSTWGTAGLLTIGEHGSGSMAVAGGGLVTSGSGMIGRSPDAEGNVWLQGAGTHWSIGASLTVGSEGEGTLVIAEGATLLQIGGNGIVGEFNGGSGEVLVTGTDSRWDTNAGLVVGDVGSGMLIIEEAGTVTNDAFAWVGSQVGSQGTVIVRGAGSLWNPDSSITLGRIGAGSLTVAGDGAVATGDALFLAELAGASGTLNFGAGAGEQAAAPGTLQAWAILFGDGEATLNFNHTHSDYGFTTAVASAGLGDHAIAHLAGTTILGGDSAGFSGTTTVSGGTLLVEGILGGTLLVEGNGTLAGTGTVGTTTVAAGGTLAPGASIGALAVDGDVTFLPGAVFEVELDLAGNSDLLAVAGAATLDGGAVATLPLDGIAINTPYTILTAGGGVTGAFDSMTLDSPSAFLSPTLAYQPNAVLLELVQGASFASVALTPNQAAAGAGADSLGIGHPVWDAVVVLGEDDAREAFDALSGEIHASTLGALLDESRYIRDATNARLQSAADTDARGFWVRGLGASDRIDGDGNADRVERSVGGVFLGGDVPVGEGWRLGAALGHHRSSLDVDGRRSSADVDSTHLGAYAGRHWGPSALRLGAAWTRHDIDTERRADFNGYSEQLRSGYDASTLQLHGEYGYALDRGNLAWEPFAGLAWVQVDGDDFSEGAGPAALAGGGGKHDATYATVGVRLAASLDDTPASLRAMLGWQHAWGDTTPRVRSAFAGGDAFIVAAAPVAGNAALVDVGVDFALGNSARLGVWYGGRFGSDVRENAAHVVFATTF